MLIEIPISRDDDWEDMTRTETIYLLIRRFEPWKYWNPPRLYKWRYDGRPKWTLRLFGWNITVGRDYKDTDHIKPHQPASGGEG